MGKIISNRQGTKEGKQEYLLQYGRGLYELDRTGSYTYSWINENDLRMTEEGGVLITAYADELEVRRAAKDLEVHRAARAAALRPRGDDSSDLTAPEATGNSKETAAKPTKEVVLLAYLQEEPPPVRRRLSRSTSVRTQPAGLAAGLTATQANGGRPEIAQPAAVEASGGSHGVQFGNSTSNIGGSTQDFRVFKEPLESNRESDGRFSSRPTGPESEGSAECPNSPNRDSSGSSIRSRSRNSGTVESAECPKSSDRDSSDPSIRSRPESQFFYEYF
jgi:hypothetical protein